MDKIIKKEKKMLDKGMDHLLKVDKKHDMEMDKMKKKHHKKK